MGCGGRKKDPPGALETSEGLPAEIRSWKCSATTRRRARERLGLAIKNPALPRVRSERSGRARPPAPGEGGGDTPSETLATVPRLDASDPRGPGSVRASNFGRIPGT